MKPYLVTSLSMAAVMVLCSAPPAQAKCPPGTEFCTDAGTPPGGNWTKNPCWDKENQQDKCNKPQKPCPPESKPDWKFLDDQDGKNDGQIAVKNSTKESESKACGTITVTKTGYYKLFDLELSESCKKQLDETGYVTVTNSCNAQGWAVQGNALNYYVVMDSDNNPSCKKDSDCKADQVCRTGTNQGTCCVPKAPTFMGTFLLVAGEKNKICLHHFCPVWKAAKDKGKEMGFITAGCKGINSIHFRVDTNAKVCAEDSTLKPCTFGCKNGKCLPDPCKGKKCPGGFCKDGVCLKENPCKKLSCPYGCKNGRCLQPPSAPGPDNDKDGWTFAADCDDDDASVHPGASEVCANGKDDDCDGLIDEVECKKGSGPDAGAGGEGDDEGCACGLSGNGAGPLLPLLLVLLVLFRAARRRR